MNRQTNPIGCSRQPDPARACKRQRLQFVTAMTLCLLVMATGCREEKLTTQYGKLRGSAAGSVNGTHVLAQMFREAGGRPATLTNLSSGLGNYDVVIWAPDDFSMPTEEVREFFNDWLEAESGRTLVYIGRDYDAACDYWETMKPLSPADQRLEVTRRAAVARAEHSRDRRSMPAEECCDWFVMRRDYPGRRVVNLNGPWSLGIDFSQTHIWSQGRLDIPTEKELTKFWDEESPAVYWEPDYSTLLADGKLPLAFEVSKSAWETSRVVVVANGSFLLNLPLVDHPHRQIAGQLIESCQPFKKVAFLESRQGGPFVHSEIQNVDEEAIRGRVLVAVHWFFLGTVFCFLVYPIFGRPKTVASESPADFGQHVDAMAALMERTGDTAYAQRQLFLFHKGQHRKDAGESSNAP